MSIANALVAFAAENNYEVNPQPSPKVGATGYMDRWDDDTYRSGSIGKDMYGRTYLISRPIIFTVDGEEPVTSRVCIFQRYAAEKGSHPDVRVCNVVHTCDDGGNHVMEVEDIQSDRALGVFVQTTERCIADAIFRRTKVSEEEINVVLELMSQDTIHLTRQGKYGTPGLPATDDVRECACC